MPKDFVNIPEHKIVINILTTSANDFILHKYSSKRKTIRIITYYLHFRMNEKIV